MPEPWEEAWKGQPAAGPGMVRKLLAAAALALASAGFVVTVLWPVITVFR